MSVPKLRFPEFLDAGEWEVKKLGEVATFYNGKAYKQEELLEQGKYRVLRVGNFFTSNNWYYSDLELDETKYCDYGDLLYAWSASFGPRVWQGEKVIYHYHIWKVVEKKNINKKFLFIVLEHETERLKDQSANGLGLLHITKGTIEGWECGFPTLPEQQKIADSLSSISDRITAETQKLDTLKAHKKGLMQQLFPAEGETLPKLRFPEFRDSEEWEVARIGDFVDLYKGGAPLTPSDFIIHSNYEVIPKKAITEGGWLKLDVKQPTYCKENFYKENLKSVVDSNYLITTLRDLVPSGPSIGYIVKFEGNKNYILAQGVYGLKLNQAIIPEFLIHFSNTQKYRKIMQSLMVGSTQVHIRNSVFLNLTINIPLLPEQQKIADCLSSIDEAIAAQSQAIDLLKLHKKGLMQQLFPSVEEVKR